MTTIRVALAALALTLAACAGENHYEQLADQVTKAVVANDMRPVEKDFNALARPQLENRAKVGALSDQLNALGTFKRAKEESVAGEPAGVHAFDAEFDKGTWQILMRIDADGKIAAYQIHPLPSATP
jgi:predicted transcriptional regulator of viral defense system